MNIKSSAIVSIAVIGLLIAGGVLFLSAKNIKRQAITPDKKTETEKLDAATTTPLLEVEVSGIKNLDEVKTSLSQTMDSYRYHKANWTNLARVEMDGKTLYFGELEKVFGDGKIDQYESPVFLVNGVLYTPYGYGGNTYDIKETNWVWRYSTLNINQYVPLDAYGTSISQDELEIIKKEAGIEEITLELGKTGEIKSIEIKTKEKTKKFTGPFEAIKPFNFVTKSQYEGESDYNTYAEKWRRLPGNVTEFTEYVSDTGYRIKYPSTINGKKVTVVHESPYYDSFLVEDRQYDTDSAYMYCAENDRPQVGPKGSSDLPINKISRDKLVDWGFSKEYHAEVFSFTGPGFRCDLRTSEAFRINMFTISF
jgi:hypothetical protein